MVNTVITLGGIRGRGPQEDAIYQISKLYTIKFQRKRTLKFALFVPMFQLLSRGERPVLTPEA